MCVQVEDIRGRLLEAKLQNVKLKTELQSRREALEGGLYAALTPPIRRHTSCSCLNMLCVRAHAMCSSAAKKTKQRYLNVFSCEMSLVCVRAFACVCACVHVFASPIISDLLCDATTPNHALHTVRADHGKQCACVCVVCACRCMFALTSA